MDILIKIIIFSLVTSSILRELWGQQKRNDEQHADMIHHLNRIDRRLEILEEKIS